MKNMTTLAFILLGVLATHRVISEPCEEMATSPAYELASAHTGLMLITNSMESHKRHVQLLEVIATGDVKQIEKFAHDLLKQDAVTLMQLIKVYENDGRLTKSQEFREGLRYTQSLSNGL